MATKNNLSSEIIQRIMDSGSDKVTVQNDSFWKVLMSGEKKQIKQRSLRLISFALVSIFTVAFVLYSAVFFVQNVLLHRAELHINQFGTFIRKSYNSEYAMFLYDPAEAWAVSGIQVQEGDKLYISASGAYHTNFKYLIDATKDNHWADEREHLLATENRDALNDTALIDNIRLCRYIDMSIPPDSIDVHKPLYIDRKNLKVQKPEHLDYPALFGDVLMQIVSEDQLRDTNHIGMDSIYAIPRMQKNIKKQLTINYNGILTFGVNDSRPQNNVGQILVVMEIFRAQTRNKAAVKLLTGQLLDFPYFCYDFIYHQAGRFAAWWHGLATLIFILMVCFEYMVFCIFFYYLPFLFVKDTWRRVGQFFAGLRLRYNLDFFRNMKWFKFIIITFVLSGFISCSQQASKLTTKEELDTLCAWYQRHDFKQIQDAFGDTLKFGTAGLRAPMGPGPNRMNVLTVALATQGFANYLNREYPNSCFTVVVGYDCRHNSKEFAEIVADVFSANGIYVYLFDDMRPTPEISFAIRELGCAAGVNITASHNSKEFNGYKAYWRDGGQIVPHTDDSIVAEAARTRVEDIKTQHVDSLITFIGKDIDIKYAKTVQLALLDTAAIAKAKDLKIVYSPMHGAGYKIVPLCLKEMGINNVSIVKEQIPDGGRFESVDTLKNSTRQANPEEEIAMSWLLKQAISENADLAVATDPDADRFGFYCKDGKGNWHRIDGHQSTMLFTKYIIDTRDSLGLLKRKQPFMGRTIVTSEIVKKIAQEANIKMYDEYTGFKWIANRIVTIRSLHPDSTFIGGGEESFCYLPYDKTRDKDAPASICLLAEMTARAQLRGTTLWDDLMNIYLHYGFQREYTTKWNVAANNGKMWKDNKSIIMALYREKLKSINHEDCRLIDYSDSLVSKSLNMPETNDVLQYFTESGIKVTIRPSGTEEKLKLYFEIPCHEFKSSEDYDRAIHYTDSVKTQLENELKEVLTKNHIEIK